MSYPFQNIEKKWQKYWQSNKTFQASDDFSRPKYYVLDMFPYPSGAGLHVGHPLGYIASDIYTRFKRLEGFNVLHPMGYDAFGLPAEQYAIKTGQHPAITTDQNIKKYREQLDAIGLSFDWSREVKTCDPDYYKHTQWVFLQLFKTWYDKAAQKAKPIDELVKIFETSGNQKVSAEHSCDEIFSSEDWKKFDQKKKELLILDYRMAYLKDAFVNWCPALGTVLANDEVKDGLSVRGSHPVEQRKMPQWALRISAYADRLLMGLDKIEWPEPVKEMQRNWIGKSVGAVMKFEIDGKNNKSLEIFTTRPDTIFGVSFMVLAPESDWVNEFVTAAQKNAVDEYLVETKKRSERERLTEVKRVSGVFTGGYCLHPFTKKKIPVWIGEYVLGGYGTGAIMAVPAHDSRDYAFAKHFNLPIVPVVEGGDVAVEAYEAKDGKLINSEFLNGLQVKDAIAQAIAQIDAKKLGAKKINYKLRDANFSRSRYWGEPIPVYYRDGVPHPMDEKELPLILPDVDKYLPTEEGDPPLARAKNWKTKNGDPIETMTMPGFAGSSAYFLRYMDPKNNSELVEKKKSAYWKAVDLYVGGSEHATGHLLYSRFWNMFLFDIGYIQHEEPFQKLINQGMIQGRSNFVYRVKGKNTFVSQGLKGKYETQQIHVDVALVKNDILDCEGFKKWMPDYKNAEFILEDGVYKCGWAVEKMSKSFFNVVNPDDIVRDYGADTLRLYEMFLGPIEQSKPWNTNGIEGVYRFLSKVYRLCYDESGKLKVTDSEPTNDEYKALHQLIKKIKDDFTNFSFNTSVSAMMICLNDLAKLNSSSKKIIEPLAILLSPFAPHLAEEIWSDLGHKQSISFAGLPKLEEKYLVETSFNYPVSFNGKTKFFLELDVSLTQPQIEEALLKDAQTEKYLEGKTPKKIIVVNKRIINVVI